MHIARAACHDGWQVTRVAGNSRLVQARVSGAVGRAERKPRIAKKARRHALVVVADGNMQQAVQRAALLDVWSAAVLVKQILQLHITSSARSAKHRLLCICRKE